MMITQWDKCCDGENTDRGIQRGEPRIGFPEKVTSDRGGVSGKRMF